MTIYFSSDHHFDHANILKYCPNRGHADVEAMNEDLVAKWNTVVTDADTVYYLGDFSMSAPSMLKWTPRLNGKKVLIPGNHDKCFKRHPQTCAMYESVGWEIRHGYLDLILPNLRSSNVDDSLLARLCHFPPGPTWENKYDAHVPEINGNNPDFIDLRLCGHTHATDPLVEVTQTRVTINVGVDAWGLAPVPLEAIQELCSVAWNIRYKPL